MKLYVGLTDKNWFDYLAKIKPDELNFWQPGGKTSFKALQPNDLFLFKLHSPYKVIVGGGFFVKHTFLPISLAWEAFDNKNGAEDYYSFSQSIYKYRKTSPKIEPDPSIGCIILSSPFFFEKSNYISPPEDWKPSIVQGKTYDTNDFVGRRLYKEVQQRLMLQNYSEEILETNEANRYSKGTIIHPRLGQGAFRVMVTDVYHRRCSITGEKTLPVLDAAHIKPYTMEGPNLSSNGILLRKDLHTLYDRGYITITDDYRVEVSRRIKEDYGNGKIYYAMQGSKLSVIPDNIEDRPSNEYIRWHNENIFLG